MVVLESWSKFCSSLDEKKIIMAPFCGVIECEGIIKKKSTRLADHASYFRVT